MCRLILCFAGICLFTTSVARAQQRDTTSTVDKQLEKQFEEFDAENSGIDGELLTQFLQELAENPVNINTAALDDLLQIPGINLQIAVAILEYRKSTPFQSVSDLLKVKGIGPATFARAKPYITIGGFGERFRALYTNPKFWTDGGKWEVIGRYQETLEKQQGFIRPDTAGGFTGSPVRYFQRAKFNSRHLSLNFTQEKDAGESLSGPGDFDFNSFHLAVQDVGVVKRAVVGDYALNFGQGLVLWTGGGFGKGRDVTSNVSRNERGLRAYSSAQETDFFRGFAATVGDQLQVTAFFSSRKLTSSVVAGDSVRFPSTTGFHRTINELERRKNNELTVVGGRVRYQSRYGLIGATAYKSSFDKFITRGTARNQLFDFEGKDHSVAGVDYRGVIGNVLIFGEVARSENDAYAGIVGLESNISALTRVSMVYRNFDKAFQSFFGETFGEVSGRPRNEEGFYIGLRHDISPSVRVSTYFDQYTFEAPRVGTSQTTRGYDVLGLVEVFVNRDFQFYVLARTETSDDEILVNDEFGREFRVLADETRSSVRVQADYQVNPKIRLRTRWEWVRFSGAASDAEFGYLIFQDIRYTPNRKWKIDGRITVFDTDSFNSRVFQFENDLLYVLSNVALSDKGERMYVVVSYKPKPYIEVGGKYSISIFEDRFTVGSGLNESFGDTRSQLGLQVRLFF